MNGDSSSSSEPLLSTSSQNQGRDATDTTLSAVGNLIKLLPTGTVFVFQFLNPVLSNGGECSNPTNKWLSAILLVACGFSCVFASFTDSYTGSDNQRHYGIVTSKGLWPATVPPANSVDLSEYRLKFGDLVHALLSFFVFAVLALLNSNTVHCLYPGFESTQKTLLQVLPSIIGVIAGSHFVMSPTKRHGIGYPLTYDSNHTSPTPTSNATAPPQTPNHTV